MLRVATEKGFKWNYEIPSSRVVLGCSFSLPIFPSPVLQDAKDVDWCNHQQRAQHEPSFAPNPEGGSQAVWAWGAQISPCWITKLQLTPNRCWKHQFRWSLARDKWGQMEYNSKILPPHQWDVSGRQLGDKWEKSAKPCGPQHPQHAGRQGGETSAKPCSPQHPQHAGRQGGETSAKPCSPQHPQHAGRQGGETSAKQCAPKHPQHTRKHTPRNASPETQAKSWGPHHQPWMWRSYTHNT